MVLGVSERRVCGVLGQGRSTQRYVRLVPDDEEALTAVIVALASEFGRYGYRRITRCSSGMAGEPTTSGSSGSGGGRG